MQDPSASPACVPFPYAANVTPSRRMTATRSATLSKRIGALYSVCGAPSILNASPGVVGSPSSVCSSNRVPVRVARYMVSLFLLRGDNFDNGINIPARFGIRSVQITESGDGPHARDGNVTLPRADCVPHADPGCLDPRCDAGRCPYVHGARYARVADAAIPDERVVSAHRPIHPGSVERLGSRRRRDGIVSVLPSQYARIEHSFRPLDWIVFTVP